ESQLVVTEVVVVAGVHRDLIDGHRCSEIDLEPLVAHLGHAGGKARGIVAVEGVRRRLRGSERRALPGRFGGDGAAALWVAAATCAAARLATRTATGLATCAACAAA